MVKAHAQESAVMPAAPEKVYAVLANYREHHPHILPQANFYNFVVEEGGIGAGTVFRTDGKVGGIARPLHMRVSEPQPGRVLAETDIDTGMHTTFTVTSENGGARVTISTDWEPSPGLMGWIERRVAPAMLEKMYREELGNLAQYVQTL